MIFSAESPGPQGRDRTFILCPCRVIFKGISEIIKHGNKPRLFSHDDVEAAAEHNESVDLENWVWSIERSVFNPSCHSIGLAKLGCRLHGQKRISRPTSTWCWRRTDRYARDGDMVSPQNRVERPQAKVYARTIWEDCPICGKSLESFNIKL